MATQAPAVMDFRRNGSRFLTSDMCTSTAGSPEGDAGVRVGTEIDDEGVDAPVGQRVDSVDQRASWADWKKTVEKPRRRASVRMSFSRSLSVARDRKFRARACRAGRGWGRGGWRFSQGVFRFDEFPGTFW